MPIGGWRGDGRKQDWISPWLLACYDPDTETFQSVCRVMSGFSDEFYKENTMRFRGFLGSSPPEGGTTPEETGPRDPSTVGAGEFDGAGCAAEGDYEGSVGVDSKRSLLLDRRPYNVDTGESPRYWFDPEEVWEIAGADLTISPVHAAGRGLVHKTRGMALRFPRFIRKRPDKAVSQATTPAAIAAMFRSQPQRSGDAGAGGGRQKGGGAVDDGENDEDKGDWEL